MKQNDLKELAFKSVVRYSRNLDCPLATDIYCLSAPNRASLRDFAISNNLYYIDLVRYDYDKSPSEIFVTLSWLTPCYECSHVYLYDCGIQAISLYHSCRIKRLK